MSGILQLIFGVTVTIFITLEKSCSILFHYSIPTVCVVTNTPLFLTVTLCEIIHAVHILSLANQTDDGIQYTKILCIVICSCAKYTSVVIVVTKTVA